ASGRRRDHRAARRGAGAGRLRRPGAGRLPGPGRDRLPGRPGPRRRLDRPGDRRTPGRPDDRGRERRPLTRPAVAPGLAVANPTVKVYNYQSDRRRPTEPDEGVSGPVRRPGRGGDGPACRCECLLALRLRFHPTVRPLVSDTNLTAPRGTVTPWAESV